MTKTDMQLKQDIEAELSWDPMFNAAQIGVCVDKGAVTLLGTVDTYADKWFAEDATKRVSGVRTIAQDLKVKILYENTFSDSDIAVAIQSALRWDVLVPSDVTAKVTQGVVTLEGQVHWNFQREAAARAVRYLTGVVAVDNYIALKPQISVTQVKEGVQAALHRQATADAKSIYIETVGGKVTLTGTASLWHSIEDATTAAWAASGVTEVVNQIQLSLTH